MAAKVFFSKEITPEKVVELYRLTGKKSGRESSRKGAFRRRRKPEFFKTGILETHG